MRSSRLCLTIGELVSLPKTSSWDTRIGRCCPGITIIPITWQIFSIATSSTILPSRATTSSSVSSSFAIRTDISSCAGLFLDLSVTAMCNPPFIPRMNTDLCVALFPLPIRFGMCVSELQVPLEFNILLLTYVVLRVNCRKTINNGSCLPQKSL